MEIEYTSLMLLCRKKRICCFCMQHWWYFYWWLILSSFLLQIHHKNSELHKQSGIWETRLSWTMLEAQAIQLIKMREKWVGLGYSRTKRKHNLCQLHTDLILVSKVWNQVSSIECQGLQYPLDKGFLQKHFP